MISRLLVAVPNGGFRNSKEASRMKVEGIVAGAADLLLLIPRGECGCLGIEMKAGKGRQTEHQKAWQKSFEKAGNRYEICRSFDEFRKVIEGYLRE